MVKRRPVVAALLAVSAVALVGLLTMGGALIVQQSLWNQALSEEVTRANDEASAAETGAPGRGLRGGRKPTKRGRGLTKRGPEPRSSERETQFTLYTNIIARIKQEGQLSDVGRAERARRRNVPRSCAAGSGAT